MKKLSLQSVLLTTVLSLIGVSGAIAAEKAASLPISNNYDYSSSCPKSGGNMIVDAWKFYKCECTSYVASKLNKRGVSFTNTYKGVKWGYATNWSAAAKAARVGYDNKVNVGDVAWFSYGHVAYVERVLSDNTIDISEYNYPYNHNFHTRNIKKTDVSAFIHF